jgi:L-alanine-DL-glutamate epimerase-like enolase superfamily enzyme
MSIEIQKISTYTLGLRLKKPYTVSGGRVFVEEMQSTIVALETNTGLMGWGEGCPFGNAYLPAFAAGIRAGIAELAPYLLGENPLHIGQINHLMDSALAGHGYVKSALDMACWDILGQHCQLPVYALLGGRFSEHADLLGVFANGKPEEMVQDMRDLRALGYRIFSPKMGGDVSIDIARIQAILADLQPEEKITIDANRAWLPDQAVQIMNSVNKADVYFEQPCETLDECLAVRRLTHAPIILDECIHRFEDLLRAQREGIAQGINIKIGRVGGLSKAKQMRDFCVATGLRMNIEETGGTIIAGTAAVHLAVATPLRYRLATSDSTRLHTVVPAQGGYVFEQGKAMLSDAVGLGVSPQIEALGDPIAVYE